jgi:inorganic pyrophosphatase
MHPWHDSYVDDAIVGDAFPVVIEIPKGSKNKYELDKETGLLKLDRVLYSYPLTLVEARAIGVMRMRDEKGIDDKIVAVSVHDPAFSSYTDKAQLPGHLLLELRRFFEDYKALEHKQVIVEDLLGPEDAVTIIRDALELYRKLRRGEIVKV